MSTRAPLGHVVWHDLMTPDVAAARRFYACLMGWNYEVEHAEDFVWQAGEGDYPLLLAKGMAHGGFVQIEQGARPRWLAYVEVGDVDTACAAALSHQGAVERTPFDVPGVGRGAVIRDPCGAAICPFETGHDHSPPKGVFLPDMLMTTDVPKAASFYASLFGWKPVASAAGDAIDFTAPDGTHVASIEALPAVSAQTAQWVPYLAVGDADAASARAVDLGASLRATGDVVRTPNAGALIRDPTGAIFGLRA